MKKSKITTPASLSLKNIEKKEEFVMKKVQINTSYHKLPIFVAG